MDNSSTLQDLATWATETNLEDLWYISIAGHLESEPITLLQAEARLPTSATQPIHLMPAGHAPDGDWIPIKPTSAPPPIAPSAAPAPPAPLPRTGHICGACGSYGRPKRQIGGSFAVEMLLWCFFLLPGLIYSIWRSSTAGKGCAHCGGQMIPLSTPRGQTLAHANASHGHHPPAAPTRAETENLPQTFTIMILVGLAIFLYIVIAL